MCNPPNSRTYGLEIADLSVPVVVTKRRQAKRATLRIKVDGSGVAVSIPEHVSYDHGIRFARDRAGWIADRLAALPPRVSFEEGARISVFGTERVIRIVANKKPVVRLDGDVLFVGAGAKNVAPHVERWLRHLARSEFTRRASDKARYIGRVPARIRVGDLRSRWGSCSSSGTLSFAWRLVMAPEVVVDYVVAHEVSHLRFHHHGVEFWRLVAELSDNMRQGREWLRREGGRLHRYG